MAATTAVGVARTSEQGQMTTSTVMECIMLCNRQSFWIQ